MSGNTQLRGTGLVIFFGLCAMSQDLRWAWQHSPYDQGGWVLALLWLGIGLSGARKFSTVPPVRLLLLGVAAGFVSFVGELNVARHLALVLVVAAWMPNWNARLVFGLVGVCWWPALGWAAAKFTGPTGVLVGRSLVLILGTVVLWRSLTRAPKGAA